ncbi:hypothetical protein EAF04_008248 [Stromatinia cepivora]|nr:hypothetical protein EAF04_008248 [Stromatinia cepivora]
MSLVHASPEKMELLQLPTVIRQIIWNDVLSEKENQYIQSSKQTMFLSLLLTCRTMYFDIGTVWPKAYLENQTFSFRTLESFLRSAPLYTHAEQALIRSVHIQFHETPDSERYQGSPQVPYPKQNFILNEILLPKYHGIREWTFDVSNLFSKLGKDNAYTPFMQRHISYFLRFCSAENLKLVFNTCDGSIMNCGQPREGFELEKTVWCDLHEYETIVERISSQAQRWNGTSKAKHLSSRMLILRRPTLTSRVPNPSVPYYKYSRLNDPRDPWVEIKADVRRTLTHGSQWRLQVWKRDRDRKLDKIDKANAFLIPLVRIGGMSDVASLIESMEQMHL